MPWINAKQCVFIHVFGCNLSIYMTIDIAFPFPYDFDPNKTIAYATNGN